MRDQSNKKLELLTEMDKHFQTQIKNINVQNLTMELAENVSASFNEMFEVVFNSFKDHFV